MNKKVKITLGDIALARSGDKGANSNIGIIAYTEAGYTFLNKSLTTQRVQEYFSTLDIKSVVRYELPNLTAFNFILHGALGEGGSRSLYSDAQGKALGQKILQMPLLVNVSDLAAMQSKKSGDL